MSTDKATGIIEQIRSFDATHTESVYRIAKLLTTLRDHAMHEALGYESFNDLVKAELPFSVSKANSYLRMQHHLTRLRYTKRQTLVLLSENSPGEIAYALARSDSKLTADSVSEANRKESNTVAFTVQLGKRDFERLERTLQRYGLSHAKVNRTNVSASLMALIDAFEAMVKDTEAA